MVRAKFKCESVEEFFNEYVNNQEGLPTKTKSQETVTLRAVYSADPGSENYTWSKYTPSGMLSMAVTNPDCWGRFEIGAEYYIDIAKCK